HLSKDNGERHPVMYCGESGCERWTFDVETYAEAKGIERYPVLPPKSMVRTCVCNAPLIQNPVWSDWQQTLDLCANDSGETGGARSSACDNLPPRGNMRALWESSSMV